MSNLALLIYTFISELIHVNRRYIKVVRINRLEDGP